MTQEASTGRKRWLAAGGLSLLFVVSFFVFDRVLMLGLKASATRYYASLDPGEFRSNKTVIFGQGDGDILVFGSSRGAEAFGVNQLSTLLNKRVVKDANAGRYPLFFYYYYQKYRKEHAPPAAVFYAADYFVFEHGTSAGDLALLDKTIKIDVLNPSGPGNKASPFLSRISWLFRKKPKIDEYLGDRLKLNRAAEEEGAAGVPGKENPATPPKQRKKKKRVKSIHPRIYQSYPGTEGVFLKKLLRLLEEDGVPVFIVILPDYAGTNETNFEQNKFKTDIATLARPHKNAAFLDFNRPDRFDLSNPALFREGDTRQSNCHLSFEGRKRFTRKLIDAVRPLLSGRIPGGGKNAGEKP